MKHCNHYVVGAYKSARARTDLGTLSNGQVLKNLILSNTWTIPLKSIVFTYILWHFIFPLPNMQYNSPSLIRPSYLPRNCGHIREVAFGEREK